jgi:hypothetical protein
VEKGGRRESWLGARIVVFPVDGEVSALHLYHYSLGHAGIAFEQVDVTHVK